MMTFCKGVTCSGDLCLSAAVQCFLCRRLHGLLGGGLFCRLQVGEFKKDPQIGNKWKELRTPTRGEINNIFCRHANCGCNPDEGYGLFGMVEQQHSDILSALARGSQEDSRGEEIEVMKLFFFPPEILYFLIVPDISLMFSCGYIS